MEDILDRGEGFPNAQEFHSERERREFQWLSLVLSSGEGDGNPLGRDQWRDDFYSVGVDQRDRLPGFAFTALEHDPVTLYGRNEQKYSLQDVILDKVVVSRISDRYQHLHYQHLFPEFYNRMQNDLGGFRAPPPGTNVTFYFKQAQNGIEYRNGWALQPERAYGAGSAQARPIHAKAISLTFGSNQAEKWTNVELERRGELDARREAAGRAFLSQIRRNVGRLFEW